MLKVIVGTFSLLVFIAAAVIVVLVVKRPHQNADIRLVGNHMRVATVRKSRLSTHLYNRRNPNRLPADKSWPITANLTSSQITSSSNMARQVRAASKLMFTKRREAIRVACKQRGNEILNAAQADILYRHMIVDDRHRLIYCYVPKAACTSWKMVMLVLTRSVDSVSKVRGAHIKGKHKMMSDLTRSEREKRMKTYKKFMVHREPFSRLLSAYFDKFRKSSDLGLKFGRTIVAKYRVNETKQSLQSGLDVKFSEFVRFVLDWATHFGWLKLNEHWQPQVSLCQPCAVDYDYYSEMETVESDAEAILRLVGAASDVKFPQSHVTNSTQNVMQFYGDLDQTFVGRLLNLYRKDYAIFGYTKPKLSKFRS